jgi:aminoglycoside phosphotransferase family enzyme/predicted kinase
LIEALLEPRAWPERPEKVELQQTHISYLFFTPHYVYKVKKPVEFGFLDFGTLEKRFYFCREEVRLNRRLAPGVYLDVVPITSGKEGITMGGEGEVLEYAVKMKRLPAETMLEVMLEKESVTRPAIQRVAETVASFHKKAETSGHIAEFGNPGMVKNNTDENFAQTRDYIGRTITKEKYDDISSYTDGFLSSNRGVFLSRVEGGFIKDCHGDIHSEHISISDDIQIYDCIEFNERFRYSDVVADAAFLSMDLDFHNRHDLARLYDDVYFSSTGDLEGRRLLDFYKCYRAFVRGKVEGFKLMEPEETEEDKREALLKTRLYFHLAHLYATGGFRPTMLVLRGFSGTGKSALAGKISHKTGFCVRSSDKIRKALLRTYTELIEKGFNLVESGRSVILDATFSKLRYLKSAEDKAKASGALFKVVECVAGEDVIKTRLLGRASEEGVVSDAGWEIYLKYKKLFEPFEGPKVVLETQGPPEEVFEAAIERLFPG